MFWRLPPSEYEAAFRDRSLEGTSGGPNKDALAALVASGTTPGLLAYRDELAVGWVSVAPCRELARLEHVPAPGSRDHPADERAWSIGCFYVHRSAGRAGVGSALLDAAVEGYPVKAGSVDPYTGYDTMFARAGFRLLQPGRGKGRALWRKKLSG
jgi:ribosomal protein S18 acetylase RimI-like enzyme